jgi:hypothetical protein
MFQTLSGENSYFGASGTVSLTSRIRNTIFGSNVVTLMTTGSKNTCFGRQCGNAITTQTNNTYVGGGAGQTKSGSFNTAVGFVSQQIASSSQYNTSLGYQAHLNSGGNYNTAIGVNALTPAISTANNNTAVGNTAGFTCKASSNCSFFGGSADQDVNTSTYTNSTAIGNGSMINASNQMVLGNSSVTSVKTSGAMNAANYLVNGTNINTIYCAISDTNTWLGANTFTGKVSGITKAMVGLGNVDNTAIRQNQYQQQHNRH